MRVGHEGLDLVDPEDFEEDRKHLEEVVHFVQGTVEMALDEP